ncbi:DNA polymerase Y family protein [Pseudolysinimonas sp.]|uniref:DNA polymerase Y family protein n=1 Tax=Pseudolysinimonas sp. TaxID=2680009 RepID=UPI003F7DDB31
MRSLPRLLVLWVPDWPVLAHARAERIPSAAAIALVEKNEVVACSARAREEGVRRGMRVREAQARSPQLHVLRYDAALDARAFEPLLAALEQSLPGLHPLRPGTVAVRARGPARYYGGERAAGMHVLGIARDLGAGGARVGVADGLFAAERAAKDGDNLSVLLVEPGSSPRYLAPLPVTLLDDPELVSLLPRLGIRTLGAFAALGADDVLARFGPAGARLHALAGGRDARPATPRIPPKDVDAIVDFEPPLDRVDQIAFGVRQPADEFVAALLAQKLVCTALRVEVLGDRGEASERVWLHPRSFSPAEIVDRVRWQVAGALDPRRSARPTEGELRSPVTRVRLTPDAVDPAGAHERGLWGTGPDEGVHSALSRVQGMVGHEGVLTAAPSGGRSPAERQTLVPWGDRPLVARDPAKPWPGALPAPAPATVYELPRGIVVEDPRGAPVTVDARGRLSGPPAVMVSPTGARRDLTAWAGPWPLDERWWDLETARRVDRFQAVDTEGVAWLLVLDEGGWWAEGRYD